MSRHPTADSAFQINVLGYRVRLSGPAEAIGQLRRSLYTGCQEDCAGTPDRRFRIEETPAGYRLYQAGRRSRRVLDGADPSALFWWLDQVIWDDLLEETEDLLQVYGAAVAEEGRGVLLFGESGTGKTSLVVNFLRRAYGFCSDELAIVHPGTLRLLPFPRNVMIREPERHGGALVRHCERVWSYYGDSRRPRWFVDPAFFGEGGIPAEAVVGQMIFLHRTESGPPSLKPMGARAAFEEIAENTMNLDRLQYAGVEAIASLVGKAERWQVSAPDPEQAWRLLEAHFFPLPVADSAE